MKISFSLVGPLLGIALVLDGFSSAHGARNREKEPAQRVRARKLDEDAVSERFIAEAVRMDLPKLGDEANPLEEEQHGHMVKGCASWNYVVTPMTASDVISVSGSGNSVEIKFASNPSLDKLGKMFPQSAVMYVGNVNLNVEFESDSSTPGLGFLEIGSPENVELIGDTVHVRGRGVPIDFLFRTLVIGYDDPLEDRRRMEEKTSVSVQDQRDLQFSHRLTVLDTTASVGPFSMDIDVGVTVEGQVTFNHRFENPCIDERCVLGICVCVATRPRLLVTAGAEVEIKADAGFLFTFMVARQATLFEREQSNPHRHPIPGVGATITVPTWLQNALRALGINVASSYGINLFVAAPWFIENTIALNAQFQTEARYGITTGKKGFEATLEADFGGVNLNFRQTVDEPPRFFSETPPTPTINDIEADATIEVYAGFKPQLILDIEGIATGAVGLEVGLSGSASAQNPPFLPAVESGLPFEVGRCDNCHRIQLGVDAVARDPFFWYQLITGNRREIDIADRQLALALLRVCLWSVPSLPRDTCLPDSPTLSPTQSPTPEAEAMGEPHFKTWGGSWFDYMGECDLKLIHIPNFDGKGGDLTVHVRTTIRYDYSYIESAALRIGADTLEVSSWGDYSLNDVEGALSNSTSPHDKTTEAPTVGGYPIFHTIEDAKKHSFAIVLPHKQNITISSMKDIVSVKVHQPSKESFVNVEGLMGSYDGKLLARDGVTDLGADFNAFGQEWQVRNDEPMLFRYTRAPQFPALCRLPDMAKKEARRLGEGILEDDAEVACAHLKADIHLFSNCVYDVTATNDLDQAKAY